MNESMLHSLMRLFALMVGIHPGALHVLARNFVESFLIQQFSRNLADRYLQVFDQYARELDLTSKDRREKRIASYSVKILSICHRIVEELHITHRFMILLSLLRFTKYFGEGGTLGTEYSGMLQDAVNTVSEGLLISREEFDNCAAFIRDKFYTLPDKKNLLLISDDPDFMEGEIRHVQKDKFRGQLFVLRISRADLYLFQYVGKERLEMGGKYIFPRHVYIFPRAGSIRAGGMAPIHYSDIVSGFLTFQKGHAVHFYARDLSYRFRNSENGIRPFSFQGVSGQLVGIIGGSGSGKSTLLKLMNGSLPPHSGGIYINGRNLHRRTEALEGMIGYIPQDDLLIEELTVIQNLRFNARLCLDGYSPGEIDRTVTELLKDLDLFEVRHLKVGSPLNKTISGGQRKRLNIALELIREPHILFVDEPTSGLSSSDSENVMALLREQTLKGKLVFSTIHQPSSDLFKQFDWLIVLDKGGYPVYSGNPLEGITYFKQLAERVDAGEDECPACGTTHPDEILKIMEARNVDEFGAFTPGRRIAPAEWFANYKERIESKLNFRSDKQWIPYNRFISPGPLKQFFIFFQRNLLSKIADRQFISIALLVPPILAVILGYFSKYVAGDETDPRKYLFSLNENLPAYLFMSVIVAIFLGMIVAAEEIIKDRRILERESFLRLNRGAYLFSKVSLLFLLSAIQMILFVVPGNLIMEIRGMTFSYWLILFSAACFANLLGLVISDGLKSVVAIYITVPFLLVPQILLAGVIVPFDKLYYRFSGEQVVPLAGDLMASRWAYEALTVHQFMKNSYQEPFTDLDRFESNVTYDMQFLVPAIIQELEDARKLFREDPSRPEIGKRLKTARTAMASIFLTEPYEGTDRLYPGPFNLAIAGESIEWLERYKIALNRQRNRLLERRDLLVDSLKNAAGGLEEYLALKRSHHNERLADLVLNRSELKKIVRDEELFVRKMDPVYMYPSSRNGRAHFYSSLKQIGDWRIPARPFNLAMIWIMTILLYILLHFSVLNRLTGILANWRRNR